jgi:two-component system phosphate regulon response regulator OmpR
MSTIMEKPSENTLSHRKVRILVVDDDMRLRELLRRYLSDQGFTVEVAPDAAFMEKAVARDPFDLIVLDLMLPGEDGLSICRRLRHNNNTIPIIMLTAKGDEADRILGLETGADDYLAKPFNPRELVARINAIMRRLPAPTVPSAPSQEPSEDILFGCFSLNIATRELKKNGEPMPLTSGEFALLKVLTTHPREPLSRERLMDMARGRDHEIFDRSIDVQVSRLRRLIETDSSHPRHIQTVWGFGYVFVPDTGN